jgi:hypothetical protein
MERSWSENVRFTSGVDRPKSSKITDMPMDSRYDTNGSINSERESVNSMHYVHFTQEETRQTNVDAHDLVLSMVE